MKMPTVLHFILALQVLLLLSSLGQHGCEARPVRNCCLKTTNYRVRLEELKKYSIQKKPLCPVKALRFTTDSVTFCSDPSSPWAIKARGFLDKKKMVATDPMTTSQQTTSLTAVVQTNSTSMSTMET